MANNYESLKTDGHYTLAYRIFLKLRNWIIDFVKLERPNDPTTYTVSSEDGSVDLSGSSSSSVAYTDEYGIRHVAASSNFDLSVQEVNGHTVNSDVPANAEFTDYKSKITGSSQGLEHTDIAENLTFLNTDFDVAPGIVDLETGIVYNIISLLHSVGTDVPSNAVFTDTLPMAYCDTNAGTTAKVAKCTNFSLKNNSFIPINFKNGNTVASGTGVTLNINNTGAKPVYVDFDDDSVPTDEPFDAGTYILYYTNQAYYLYTNGVLYPYRDVAKQNDLRYYSFGSQDGSVTIVEGSSSSGGVTTYTENFLVQKVNGHTVNSDVPSNAIFTDTTYTAGDNVNISQQNVISADQIDDSYNYQQYQNLPSSTKMQDKLFIVDDAPDLDPAILNLVYPVGTYYETSDTTFNPNVTWGGTWVLEDEGLVHISSGTNYVVSANAQDGGSTQITYTPAGTNSGGAVQGHKLVTSEMPSHIHGFQMAGTRLDSSGNGQLRMQSNVNAGSGNFWVVGLARTGSGNYDGSMTTTGGDGSHNHGFTDPTFTGTQATLDNMQPYKIVNRWHRTA